MEKHLVLKRLFAFIKGFSLLRGWADDPDALDEQVESLQPQFEFLKHYMLLQPWAVKD